MRILDRLCPVDTAIGSDFDFVVVFHVAIFTCVHIRVESMSSPSSREVLPSEALPIVGAKVKELFDLLIDRVKRYDCWTEETAERQNKVK